MRARIATTAAVGVLALSLTACGGGSSPSASGGSSSAAGSSGSAQPTGTITLYTSEPDQDAATLIAAFNKQYPDVKVNVFRSGTEQVVSKIEAEKQAGSVQADVVFLADALTMQNLQKDGVLAKYTSPNAKKIPSEYVTPYYAGTKIIATGIAINTTKVTTAPTSWFDLNKPDAKGSLSMPSPLYSGAAAYNVAVMANDPTFGWDFWEKLAAQNPKVEQGNGAVLKDVAGGEQGYGMVVDYVVIRAAAQGSPVKFIYPKEGVPFITEPIGITTASKNQTAAKAFEDFVLSDAGQKVAAQLSYDPIVKGAPVPKGMKGIDQIKAISGDPAKLAGEVNDAKQKFQQMFH